MSQSAIDKRKIGDLGAILSYSETEFGIEGNLENGQFKVTSYSPKTVRVQLSSRHSYDTNPYSVVAHPETSFSQLSAGKEVIKLETNDLIVSIQMNPIRFSFFTKQGDMLSADDDGLGISKQGDKLTLYRTLQDGERFLGMGEKTGHLDRRGSGFQNWNTDRFGYGSDQDPLYASIPFFIGIHHGLVYGIYLDNSHASNFNFGASNNRFSSLSVDGGDLDYYFITGSSVQEVITEYTHLTGRIPLPPVWSIGYQQCRYSYYPQNEVLRVAGKFRDQKIPADVIVLDIHYMEKFKIFSWDGERFPNPEAMIKTLKERGFEVVVICDPGIKVEEGYDPYDSGLKEDVFIKYPDGTQYTGAVWPGWCHFPDFTSENGRKWWKSKMKSYTDLGIKGYWNDMNEIASWGNMMPNNLLFDFDGNAETTLKARNIYGYQMARATYEAAKELTKERPFNLTRAGFAGLQRYTALWTGDNVSSDEHMMLAVRMVLNLGMSGVAFAGCDIGGFVGNANGQLFARWMQIGAFSPFFRSHTMINSNSAEPWSFGEEVEEITTNFIRLRYKLLPYLYQAFYQASIDGTPINRSLALDYTFDDRVYDHQFENQFLFGKSILVAPLESYKNIAKVFLPEGQWHDLYTGERFEGDQEMFVECGIKQLPVYVKGSSIVTTYPEVGQHTRAIGSVLELHIYHGSDTSEITYYEDDGTSFDFEKGVYHKRAISYHPEKRQIKLSEVEGTYSSKMKTLKVRVHGLEVQNASVNGKKTEVSKEDFQFIAPISNFDPMVTPDDSQHPRNKNLPTFELDYLSNEMIIHLG